MRWVWVALVVVMVSFGVSCSSDGESADVPSSTTPATGAGGRDEASLGLASVALPDSETEVVAVFTAMPDELLGLSRLNDDPETVARYGGELNVLSSGLAADFDTGAVLADLEAFEGDVEASDLNPEAEVVWLLGSFEERGGVVHVASWGDPKGEWIFAINAESAEMRKALIEAFVDTT